MIARLLDAVFGCWHSRYSFPRTVHRGSPRNAAALLTGTYVVCLDCGKELPYDWQAMRVIASTAQDRLYRQSLAAKHAA